MSRDHDQFDNTWGDDDERQVPRSFYDGDLDGRNQNRPRQRSNDPSQDIPPSSPGRAEKRRQGSSPGGGRIYEENDDRPSQRPRPTRQSHDEALARLRQRPRQPIYSREQEELPPPQPPARRQEREIPPRAQAEGQPRPQRERANEYSDERPFVRPTQSDEYANMPQRATRRVPSDGSQYASRRSQDDYEDEEEYEPPYTHRRHREHSRPPRRRRGNGGRGFIGTFLLGCLGGLLTLAIIAAIVFFLVVHNTPLGQSIGKSTYTHQEVQELTLGNATQIIVKNQIGNISVNVDSSVSNASISSTKKVLAGSQSEANSAFSKITFTSKMISRGEDPSCLVNSCLLVSTTVPTTSSSGLLGSGNSNMVDLILTLPQSFNSPDPQNPYTLSATTTSGNLSVNGFNGILNLSGSLGVTISRAIIFAGTCIQVTHGDLTISQNTQFDLKQASTLVPCSNTTDTGSHPWFRLTSGIGNINVTFPTSSTSLKIQAYTNSGKITGDFNLNASNASDGSSSFEGSLLPDTSPIALLYIEASTGDILLHKQ